VCKFECIILYYFVYHGKVGKNKFTIHMNLTKNSNISYIYVATLKDKSIL
jgi:hypothetical protein